MNIEDVKREYAKVQDLPEHWSLYQLVKRLCEYILEQETK